MTFRLVDKDGLSPYCYLRLDKQWTTGWAYFDRAIRAEIFRIHFINGEGPLSQLTFDRCFKIYYSQIFDQPVLAPTLAALLTIWQSLPDEIGK